MKTIGKTEILIISLYVDDLIYMSNSDVLLNEFKRLMMNEFEMTDLGMIHYFLGLEIKQCDAGIFVSQEKYVNDLLRRFNLKDYNGVSTPMCTNQK